MSKKIPTHPPFDNVIPLKLLKLDKILPYQTKAQDYITSPHHYGLIITKMVALVKCACVKK